jgi:pSer/pThr/pTyr-binding forkhead associated (FHA) protein
MIIAYSYSSGPTKKFASESDSLVIGRPSARQTVDLDLTPDNEVSRTHARITQEDWRGLG